MKKRIKKKRAVANTALKLAMSMNDWKLLDKQEKRMFLKICFRAVIDKFPLDEYFIFEIPLRDKDFWVFCFFGLEYKKDNPDESDFRQIDFWIYKTKNKRKIMVVPAALDEKKNNCFEAVY
ncbi:MAG: hypothetical protein MSH60_04630 [Ruminococcus sp.]|nr:hypothetical protein [Ruminococcus sp.]